MGVLQSIIPPAVRETGSPNSLQAGSPSRQGTNTVVALSAIRGKIRGVLLAGMGVDAAPSLHTLPEAEPGPWPTNREHERSAQRRQVSAPLHHRVVAQRRALAGTAGSDISANPARAGVGLVMRRVSNTIKRVALDELNTLCEYLSCEVRDLLKREEVAG